MTRKQMTTKPFSNSAEEFMLALYEQEQEFEAATSVATEPENVPAEVPEVIQETVALSPRAKKKAAQAAKAARTEARRLAKAAARAAKSGVPKPAPKKHEKVSIETLNIPDKGEKEVIDMMTRERKVLVQMVNSLLDESGTRREGKVLGEAIERVLDKYSFGELLNKRFVAVMNMFCRGYSSRYLEDTFGITVSMRNCLVDSRVNDRRLRELNGARRTLATYNGNTVSYPKVAIIVKKEKGKLDISAGCVEFLTYTAENVLNACGGYGTESMTIKTPLGYETREVSARIMSISLVDESARYRFDVVGINNKGDIFVGKDRGNYLIDANAESDRVTGKKPRYSIREGGVYPLFEGKLYYFFGNTTSNLRKEEFLALRCSAEEARDNNFCNHVRNVIMEGELELAAMKQDYTYEKLFKTVSRLGLPMSPGKTVDTFKEDCGFAVAYYVGTFEHDECQFDDGGSYVSAKYMSQVLSLAYSTPVSDKDATKFCPQYRLGGAIKAFGITLMQHQIDNLVDHYASECEVVHVGMEDHDAFVRMSKGEYDGKIVIIGEGPIAMFIDKNNAKLSPNFCGGNTLRFLDIAKNAPAVTNIQILQGISGTEDSEEFEELVHDLITNHIDNKINEFLNRSEREVPVDIDSINSLYVANIVGQMNSDYAKENAPIWKASVQSLCNSLSNDINSLNFEIPGNYARLTGDFGAHYGVRILRDCDTYNPALPGNSRTSVYRCPKAGFEDQALLINVSYREICRRIDKLQGLSEQARLDIKEFYRNIPKGVAVLPATEVIKSYLGGSDYDYDGAIFIADVGLGKRWNDIADKIGSFAVSISDSTRKVSRGTYSLSHEAIVKCFYDQCNNENLSVGQVCNQASMIMSAMFSDAETLDIVTHNLGLRNGGENEYRPIITTLNQAFGVDDLAKIESWARGLNLDSDETLKAFLKEYILIMPVCVGLTIDSAKNSLIVPVPFYEYCMKDGEYHLVHDLKKMVHRLHIANGENPKVVVDTICDDNYKGKKEVKHIECVLSRKKEEAAHYAASALEGVLNLCRVSEDEKAKSFLIEMDNHNAVEIMKAIRMQYTDIANTLVREQDEFKKESIKEVYNELLNTARVLTNDLSLEERGKVARYVSVTDSRTGKYSDLRQSSMMNAFVPEMIAMLLNKEDSVKVCGAPIALHEDMEEYIGKKVRFVDGVSVCGLTHKAKINGWFTIQVFGDRTYAVCPIDQYIGRNKLVKDMFDSNRVMIKLENKTIKNCNLAVGDLVILDRNPNTRFGENAFVNKVDKANGGVGIHAKSVDLFASMYNKTYMSKFDFKMLAIENISEIEVVTKNGSKKSVVYVYGSIAKDIDTYTVEYKGNVYTKKKGGKAVTTAAMPTVEEEVARFNSLMSC